MVDVAQLTSQLEDKLVSYRIKNREKTSYYDGSHKPRNVGFSVPPKMRRQAPRLGWAGIVVDALEERIQFQGWADPSETLGLDKVYQENRLDVEAGLGHLDALTFGTGFVTVGRGVGGEPDPLVTVTSTMDTTGVWDGRTRRLSSAFTMNPHVDGQLDSGLLYLPDATLTVVKDGGQWRVASNGTDNHGLGRVPVVMLPNRTSASMLLGRSEINDAVRDLIDEGARVLLAMAVNREFFSAPQRLVLGAAPDDLDHWKALMAGIWAIEPDGEGNLPTVTEFKPVPPGPYIDQLRALAGQLAAVSGVPEAYFGVSPQANPSSADAIRALEVRLIKKAERRCSMFGLAWLDVAELVCLFKFGHRMPELAKVSCKWGDPATPTRAAIADETSKLVAAGVLPPTSSVTMDRLGLTAAQQDQVAKDRVAVPTMADVLSASVTRQTQAALPGV